MSAIEIFDFDGQIVRTVTVAGDPWFVAADACRVLELSNPSVVVNRLDDDERAKFNLGRQGEATIVSEPGLYSLILGSRKPEARAFKRWITHDVIPSLRKTGKYGSDVEMLAALPSSELLALAAEAAKRAETAEAKIAIDAPKVDYVDEFVRRGDVRLFRNVAKCLGMRESELRDDLLARKWIYCETIIRWSKSKRCDEEVHRYSAYSEKARYFYPAPSHKAPRFRGEAMHTLKITPRGAIAIAKLYGVDPAVMDEESSLEAVA
ncbi:BRO family protein [Leucobacter japonicus]|uniref:BRO family protein n=1 Tax=Leucobacter japonicus TaxID=1461259 RepID=UPI0006A79408|nr:BRO family protein [Leucobacter japonicus]